MSLYASYDDVQITDARIVVPKIGAWFADLTLATEKQITGTHTLTVGDIAWTGTVWRGSPFQGRTRLRLIGGLGGWQKQLRSKAYRADAGVKLSTVLEDAARECGEQGVTIATDRLLGTFFVRDVAPAERMLNRLATEWHVGLGVVDAARTIVGPWTNVSAITERIDLVSFDGSSARAEIATEALASFTPGRTFFSPVGAGIRTVNSVVHTISGTTVRTEVLAAEVRP